MKSQVKITYWSTFLLVVLFHFCVSCENPSQQRDVGEMLPLDKTIEPLQDKAKDLVIDWDGYKEFDTNMRIISNTNALNVLDLVPSLHHNMQMMKADIPDHYEQEHILKVLDNLKKHIGTLKSISLDEEPSSREVRGHINKIFQAFDTLNGHLNEVTVRTI